MTEAELTRAVRVLARMNGWLHYHTFDSRRSEAGFPDLVLVRKSRVVFAELKSVNGRVSKDQSLWLEALRRAGQEVYLWRPKHLLDGEIIDVLTRDLAGAGHG